MALSALALLRVTACTTSGPCTLHAAAYDQSCNVDSDCAAVTELNGCGECACATGAINKRDLSRYQSDLAGGLSSAAKGCFCPCERVAPLCCAGLCTNSCGGCMADASSLSSGSSSSSGGASSGGSSGSSSSGGPSSSGSTDSSSDGYATLCPVFSGQPTCPAASDANGCNLSLGTNCAADALPQGLACSGLSQCQARIGPVDGCGRADGWICSCIDGRWSCDDCALGQALCLDGAGAYELPEGDATGE